MAKVFIAVLPGILFLQLPVSITQFLDFSSGSWASKGLNLLGVWKYSVSRMKYFTHELMQSTEKKAHILISKTTTANLVK